jgi:hypothetical protein
MSGEAILATPARPLYEPSHRPPKKRSARSRSLFAQITRFGELLPISEMAPPHSITSSAPTRRNGGIVRPSVLAVLMLMTKSKRVGP